MANDVVFVKQSGRLGRPLPGEDFISGYLHYTATLPSGFASDDRIKQVFSIEDAEALGITNTHLGETASTATYQFTTKFTAGETFVITCAVIDSTNPVPSIAAAGTVTLASFTAVTADAVSVDTSADRLEAEINLGTLTHGFTALASTDTVTITAPAGQGVFLNSGTPYVVTIVGSAAGTLTQNVVVGIASEIDIIHYHVSEYFRMQPKGNLYIGIYATADATTFASVTLMQTYALGKIRQIGIYQKTTGFATSQCNTLQAILTTAYTNHQPLEAIYQADFEGTSDLTTLSNLRALSDPNVTVCLGQDGAGVGFTLWKATEKSIGCVGTTLGAVAFANVNEDIAWVGKFQVAGTDFDTLAFANGDAYTSLSVGTINNLDSYGYVFPKKHIGLDGSYFNDSHTAVLITSDYAYIEMNRTINKAIRNLRAVLLPYLASPIKVNSDGTLTDGLIGFYEGLCNQALDSMASNNELSAFGITINPNQNVVSTSEILIAVELVPTGTARTITVNIGFTASISS